MKVDVSEKAIALVYGLRGHRVTLALVNKVKTEIATWNFEEREDAFLLLAMAGLNSAGGDFWESLAPSKVG